MNETSKYIVTGQVLEIAKALRRSFVQEMTDEQARTIMLDKFFPDAVKIFMTYHSEIHRLIETADQPAQADSGSVPVQPK